ncbi:hypothetical protein [Maribacter sp. HTCC2170]|uniref:hypothetical protein n=1 Tax=Maribacter sp. (strain HTCC2170 / KCCM 42371) TaxID=313603 RepID=UPI000309E9AB|nr:hypothetical protein [Maribacter sp. HTCC2170]
MNKRTILLSFTAGLLFAHGMFANDPNTEKLDINTIEYIEDDMDFELGFDTADYLPEGFDANQVYFNINSIDYIEEELAFELNTQENLPEGFSAYAYPSDVQSINYIDEKDSFDFSLNPDWKSKTKFRIQTELSK